MMPKIYLPSSAISIPPPAPNPLRSLWPSKAKACRLDPWASGVGVGGRDVQQVGQEGHGEDEAGGGKMGGEAKGLGG